MDIRTAVRAFIASNFYVGAGIGDDESLLETGVLDSTGVLEVVNFLETQFGIELADGDIVPENLETVTRMSTFVARRLEVEAERGAAALRSAAS